MPRRSKGPRLWFRADRESWFILDGPRHFGTGLNAGATADEKDAALRRYLSGKGGAIVAGNRDPSQISINDVLERYGNDVAPHHARPTETAGRIAALIAFWGGRALSEVTGDTCRAYARQRTTPAAARRELEELRAAINHHRREGLTDRVVSVVLPPRSASRERYLTRQEAAVAIRAAPLHVRRFMIFARYMGSRAAVICAVSLADKRPVEKPWVDVERGVFYGLPAGQRATKKRRQTVRVPPPLLAHLRRWKAAGARWVVEWNGVSVESIDKAHRSAIATAGLGPDVTPHTWRHTVATWLMQAGVDPFEVAGFLGMTVETLLRVYGHHHPDHSAGVHKAMTRAGRAA